MKLENISYRILRRLRVQPFLNWKAKLEIPGGSVEVPLWGNRLGSGLMLYGPSWKTDALKRFAACCPLSMICDVGAHEGQTIFDLRRAGLGDRQVFAFEPNSLCAGYLQDLVELNGWKNVTLVPVALSNEQGCLSLELHGEVDSGATLDQLIESNVVEVKPDFLLKIDVEGAELDVLRGSQNALRAQRPLVLCEVL